MGRSTKPARSGTPGGPRRPRRAPSPWTRPRSRHGRPPSAPSGSMLRGSDRAERMKNRDEVQQFLDLASAPDRIAQLRREKVQLIALQKKLLVERELERKRARVAQWDLARKRT